MRLNMEGTRTQALTMRGTVSATEDRNQYWKFKKP